MSVLVVDDDEAIRETLRALLEDEGYAVREAANGAEALVSLEQERPAVVLLDMRMPIMDGWAFAAALRDRGIRVPIAVMTAAQDARKWCDEIGGDACLPKPFDFDAMLAVVGRFCARA